VLWHAIIGATVAALLVFFAKQGLLYYHEQFEVYKNIYKELATIPVLLVWLALTWLSILIGAQVTYTIGAFRVRIGSENIIDENASLYELIRIIRIINNCKNTNGIQLNELMKEELHMSDDAILDALNLLDNGGVIHRTETRGWKMSTSVNEMTLGVLYKLLEEHLSIPIYFQEKDQCLNKNIESILGGVHLSVIEELDKHTIADFFKKQ
jgi:membrane protein